MQQPKSLASNSIKVFISTVSSSIFNFFRIIVIAKFLGPTAYGFWNLLLVIYSYGNYSHLGLLDGMNKKMPYLNGRNELAASDQVKNVSFWLVMIISTTVAVILALGVLIWGERLSPDFSLAFMLVGVLIVITQIYVTLTSLLRTDKRFGVLSWAVIIVNISSFIFIFYFLSLKNSLTLAVTGLILANALASVYIIIKAKYRFPLVWRWPVAKELFRVGLPLILIQAIYGVYISIDRWMIAGYLDSTSLGLYGLGATISTFMFGAFSVLAYTIYPYLLEKFGQKDDITAAKALLLKANYSLALIMSMLFPIILISLPLMLRYILPEYIQALNVIFTLILSVYFIALMSINGNYLISINKQRIMLGAQIVMVLFSFGACLLALRLDLGIIGIAAATLISYSIYSTLIIFFSLKFLFSSGQTAVKHILRLYSPYMVSILFTAFLMRGVVLTHNLFADIKTTLINILIFGVWGVVLLILLHKTINLRQVVKNLLPHKS
ncbi:TPA: hypothetical protein DF272_03295 [Candidatus Falkowbacteria bacterium]|nr:hypothetical protein [Candidatus Falkowbacteria bacterium]